MEYDIKGEFNRTLSKAISEITGKCWDVEPDITVIFDLETFDFDFQVKQIYIYGRYLKRVRNISQTRWICGFCGGKGCNICNYTGKKYAISVEEIIATPVIEIFKAKDAKLHGAGREDVDARMLGEGRPFVLEIIEPKKRYVNLRVVEEAVNNYGAGKVRVFGLEYTDSKKVVEVKTKRHKKRYRAKIVFEREIQIEKLLNALENLKTEIKQRTPKRVVHRRADRVRVRRVYDVKLLLHKGKIAVIEIVAEAGLYIKELISGDNGRTNPSLSAILGVNCRVERLDVLDVFNYSTSNNL